MLIGSGATPRGGSPVYLDEGEISLIRSQNIYNDGFKPGGLVFIIKYSAYKLNNVIIEEDLLKLQKRKLSEHSSDPEFPRALAPQYNKERGKAYLLCSRWVQELLFRYGRYAHIIAKYKPEYRLKQAPKDLHSSNPTL